MGASKKSSDYVYKRYRIAHPATRPVTTVSLPWLEHILMTRKTGGPEQLSAIVRAEAARIREHGPFDISLSAATLTAVRQRLKEI